MEGGFVFHGGNLVSDGHRSGGRCGGGGGGQSPALLLVADAIAFAAPMGMGLAPSPLLVAVSESNRRLFSGPSGSELSQFLDDHWRLPSSAHACHPCRVCQSQLREDMGFIK